MQPSIGTTSGRDSSLLALLADRGTRHSALAFLHSQALELTDGVCSILFEMDSAFGHLQVTSGSGVDHVSTEPWNPEPLEAALLSQAFTSRAVVRVRSLAAQMPSLVPRLGTDEALLIPLGNETRRAGLLVIGLRADTGEDLAGLVEASNVPSGFLLALELTRLRQREELEQDARHVIDAFSERLSVSLDLAPALAALCSAATRLFAADRTTVWVLDRDARELQALASSGGVWPREATAIRADDPLAAPAAGLQAQRASLSSPNGAPTSTLIVPLRGCRRALGTLVFEGVRVEPGDSLTLLNRADELGRQLSGTVETIQLLGSVTQSRLQLEHLFASIAHLIVVVDSRGRILRANKAFADAAGRTTSSLADQPLAAFVGAEFARLAEQPATLDSPIVREITDGVLGGPHLVTVTELVTDDGRVTGRVLVARDLEPLAAAREREELRGRLVQSAKLAALGQFVAGVAHELNNPLQSVLGHLELLRATGAVPEAIRHEVRTVTRDADRAARIVRNLLAFAGTGRLQRRRASVNGILQRVLALRQASCRSRRVEIVRHYDQHLPRILVDPILLHQVFLNVVMNAEQAVAATGRPGRVEVSTELGPESQWVVASIRDTGAGIADDTLPHIFDPFYTTKEVGQGTGLGLALAYGIVQEHGGRIAAGNHPQAGAVFTIELPIA